MIPLQPLDKDGEKHLECSEDRAREPQKDDAKEADGEVYVTTRRWKKVSITVTTFLGNAFLNAAISMISPFYPIVVSCKDFDNITIIHRGIETASSDLMSILRGQEELRNTYYTYNQLICNTQPS